jgi:hypothetical protein
MSLIKTRHIRFCNLISYKNIQLLIKDLAFNMYMLLVNAEFMQFLDQDRRYLIIQIIR